MTENNGGGAGTGDWILAWIQLQHEQLRRAGMPGAQSADKNMGADAMNAFADLFARMPPLGLAREQTEAWRELTAAQAEFQALQQELQGVWSRVQADALGMVEQMIRERQSDTGTGEGINNYRELYDLWVDCAEKVFAQVAHSDAYAKLQAQVGNAAIKLRAGQQAMIERHLKYFDLPTRSELNTVHKQMRELRERVATLEAQLAAQAERASERE